MTSRQQTVPTDRLVGTSILEASLTARAGLMLERLFRFMAGAPALSPRHRPVAGRLGLSCIERSSPFGERRLQRGPKEVYFKGRGITVEHTKQGGRRVDARGKGPTPKGAMRCY